jgi:serine/threonine protein kinase
VEALKKLHEAGYIHNDVKFSNTAFDPKTCKFTLIDFGASFRWKSVDGKPAYASNSMKNRQTIKYASFRGHNNTRTTRADDMIMLMFSCIWLKSPSDPWNR